MKCPKCKEEIADNSIYCPNCGDKLNLNNTMYCPNCGELTESDKKFCSNCGYNFVNISPRTPAFIFGMIGSGIGLLIALILTVTTFNSYGGFQIGYDWWIFLLYIAPIIGLISTWHLQKDRQLGAIGMIISAVLFFLYILIGWLSCFFVGLGALLVLLKK